MNSAIEREAIKKTQATKAIECDIAIIGASLTGQVLSLILKDRFKVKIIDQSLPQENHTEKGGRALVLSLSSISQLIEMGFASNLDQFKQLFWQSQHNCTAIEALEISQQQKKIKVQFNAKEHHLPFLGLSIEANAFISVLLKKNKKFLRKNWIQSQVEDSQSDGKKVKLKLEDNQTIEAKLVLIAAGNQSKFIDQFNNQSNLNSHFKPFNLFERVRNLCNRTNQIDEISQIETNRRIKKNQDQQKFALVGSVELDLEHKAYQRYSDQGVLALLPMGAKKSAWIYSFNDQQKQALEPIFQEQSTSDLNPLAKEKMIQLLGEIYPQLRGAIDPKTINFAGLWPITQIYHKRIYHHRSILIGAGAISFSPIAAQGLNLTIKDCYQLYQHLDDQLSVESLSAFAVQVEKEHRNIHWFMNALETIAYQRSESNDLLVAKVLQTGFMVLNIPYFKERFLHYFADPKA